MNPGFNNPPSDVPLSPLAREVFRVLARHTSFAWPALQAQCNRLDVDPGKLDRDALRKLLPNLALAVGRFTSPKTQAMVASELRDLL